MKIPQPIFGIFVALTKNEATKICNDLVFLKRSFDILVLCTLYDTINVCLFFNFSRLCNVRFMSFEIALNDKFNVECLF